MKKNKKKPSLKGSYDKTSQRSKRTKSDDEGLGNQLNGATVNLDAIKGLLRKKGAGTTKSKGSGKNDKKMATFVEAASKEVLQKSEPEAK